MNKQIAGGLTHKKIFFMTLVVFLIVIIAFYFFGFQNFYAGINKFWDSLLNNPWASLPLFLTFGFFILGGTLSFYWLAKKFNNKYSLLDASFLFVCGAFISNITPFAFGGQILQLFILEKQGLSKRQSTTVLLIEFLLYQVILTLIGIVLFVLKLDFFNSLNIGWFFPATISGLLINFGLVCALMILAFSKRIYDFFIKVIILFWKPIRGAKKAKKLKAKLTKVKKDFVANTSLLIKEGRLLLLTAIGVFIWLASWILLSYFSLLFIYDFNGNEILDFWDVISTTTLILTTNSFVPVPGGAGSTELLYIISFSKIFVNSFGWSFDYANAITTGASLTWRLFVFYLPIIIGIILILKSHLGIRSLTARTNKDRHKKK